MTYLNKAVRNEAQRRWNFENKDRVREHNFKAREKRKLKAAGRPIPEHCEACGDPGGKSKPHRLVFDHDHATGLFRGWVCEPCNKALGFIRDNPDRARALAEYLERSNG